MSACSCPTRSQLEDLIAGRLPRGRHESIEEHVCGCNRCQVALEALDDPQDPFLSALRKALDPTAVRANRVLQTRLVHLKSQPGRGGRWDGGSPSEQPAVVCGTLGDFRIVRELGRGGMGIVYEAEQLLLGRRVALKILPFAALLDPRQLQRFQNEARAAACLEHPNIVSVYGVGVERGSHYYAMRYIDGQNLAQVIEQLRQRGLIGAPESPTKATVSDPTPAEGADLIDGFSTRAPSDAGYLRTVAQLGVQAAEALDYAHERGIVHRDIKPSNLILDQSGRLWVADFGLARIETDPTLSMSGAILGTLRYMSPEQALGKRGLVDHRSDVYSLGVTLYELLTLTPIFPDADRATLLSRIATDEPKPPRQLNPRIPADLETVVLKAMAKNAADRYETAGGLARDLKRFLDSKPILARPVGRAHRVVKWARRRPAVAALVAISGLVILVLFAGGWWHAATLQSALTVTERLRGEAETERHEADAQRQTALAEKARAEDRERRYRQYLYAADMRLALAAWKNNQVKEVVELLSRHIPSEEGDELRTFAWHYLWRLCHCEFLTLRGHAGRVYGVAYSPDGTLLATASADGTARLWDAATGRELAKLQGHTRGEVNAVAFSPDGKTLATGGDDHTVRIWDAKARLLQATCPGHTADILAVAFSPDSKTLASAGVDRLIKLWYPMTGRERTTLRAHEGWVRGLAFSPDGRRLASSGGDGRCRVWNLETGKVQTIFNGHFASSAIRKVGPDVYSLAFAHDGRSVASGDERNVIAIWDPATGIEKATFASQSRGIRRVEFSPDDRTLVAAAHDGNVRIWDVATGKVRNTIRGHTDRLWFASLSPDGRRLATASSDRTVKVWDVEARQERETIEIPSPVVRLAFSPDGNQLVATGYNPKAPTTTARLQSLIFRVWDTRTGREATKFRRDGNGMSPILAPNARSVAISTPARPSGASRIFNYALADQWRFARFELRDGDGAAVALSSDGRSLADVERSGTINIWDLVSGQRRARMPCTLALGGLAIEFSSDAKLFAAVNEYGIEVWDVPARRVHARLAGHGVRVYGLCFSPDAKILATAGADHTIKLWNLSVAAELATLGGHVDAVRCVAISSDGKTLASGGDDGRVMLWDMRTLQELGSLNAHDGGVKSVAFSPDGKILASGGATMDNQGEIFMWSTGEDRR
jgi:WD40 repeat protein/serine/threonine protein kinase